MCGSNRWCAAQSSTTCTRASLRRCRDDNRRPDRKRDLKWLLDTARERLEELRIEMPPPSDEVYERETTDVLADLELFLDAECDGPTDRSPVGLEVAFGRSYGGDDDDDREPLAQKEPVEIDLGGGLTFRITGRIDRIDKVGPSSFEVIDYKTGGYWADDLGNRGVRRRHAPSARAVRVSRGAVAQAALQETNSCGWRLLLLQHERRAGAASHPDAVRRQRSRACSRTCAT